MRVRSQTHPGVSIKAMARSRFRLRWREHLADGTASYQSWTCTLRDIGEAERWAIEIYRSLQTMGTFVRPVDVGLPQPAPVRPRQVDLRDLWVAYAGWRISHKGIQASTAQRGRESLASAERVL